MKNIKVGLLVLATSLVMALIHPRWDLLMFSANWFACFMAVVIIVTGASAAMTLFHGMFVGREARFSAFSDEAIFYATITMLVAALLYGLLTWFGPLGRL